MSRSNFGGTWLDVVFTTASSGMLRTTSANLTFWSAQTGGTQYTVLLNGQTVTSIQVDSTGQIPTFQGPDSVLQMWVDAGAGRALIFALQDIATTVTASAAQVATDRAAVEALGTTTDAVIAGRVNAVGSATRTAIDARVGALTIKWATPEAYGAVGDGSTDDTAAVQAAINSNLPVWLDPTKTYKVAGLVARNGMRISSMLLPGTGYRASLKTTSGDMWTTPSSGTAFVTGFRFENLIMESATASGGTLMRGMWTVGSFCNVDFVQNNNGKSIFDVTGFIDVVFEGECQMQHTTSSTVPAFKAVTSTGNVAQIEFANLRCSNSGTHFFYLEGTSGAVPINIGFTNVNFEVCNGGLAKLLSCRHVVFDRCGAWDFSAAATNHLFHIDKSATSGAAPRAITFRDCIRDASTAPTGGAQDIYVESTAGMTEFNVDNCGHQLSGNYLVTAGNATGRVRGFGVTTLTTGLGMSTDFWQAVTAAVAGAGTAVGNGTITGRMRRSGNTVEYRMKFTLGTTSTIGSVLTVTLPTTESGAGIGVLNLRAFAIDTGNNFYTLSGTLSTTTSMAVYTIGTNGLVAGVTSTVPFTWGSTDSLECAVTYESV